jgi:nucleoside-diphosphate-sugar epimerase
MQILVTGGCGYLGSVLTPLLLRANHQVRVLDNLMYGTHFGWALAGQPGYTLIRGDLQDKSIVADALRDVDTVVHLAAIVGDPACSRRPSLARNVNLQASRDLIEAAKAAGVQRFVFASTCSNYGKMTDPSAMATEEWELRPLSLYAETKVETEQFLLSPGGSMPVSTILRFATLYGPSPRMRFDLTVNEFVLNLRVDRKLTLYGEYFWRPYVHVRDAARAVLAVLEAPPDSVASKVFNVGDTRENYRKRDLADMIALQTGGSITVVHKAEDPRDYKVSFERIRSSLGFTISRTVTDGINEVLKMIDVGLVDKPAICSNTF